MPTTKASKVKRVKGGKGKKNSKHESKADKDTDIETARANATLWELRLKVTEQDVADYREHSYKLASANELLTNHLYHSERQSLDMTAYWEREVAAKEEKISKLEEYIKKQEVLALEEKNKLARDLKMMQEKMREKEAWEAQMEQELINIQQSMYVADKEHREKLSKMEEKYFKEKAYMEKEAMDKCNAKIVVLKQDHQEVIAQLEGALHAAFKEHDHLNETLKNTIKETEDLKKLTNSLIEKNTLLALDKDMLESIVKKEAAQIKVKRKELSELMAKAASLEKTLKLQEGKLEQQEKEKEMSLVTIQASQVELDKLQKVLAMREKEIQKVKQLGNIIVKKRTELENFFYEALDHVRQEITASKLRYKKEALQDYHWRFREATAGKMKFPPILTFHKSPYSTNSVYSDMEAASKWSYLPDSEIQISDLTWEQKEEVLSLLFARMNGQRERKVCQHLALCASSEKQKSLNDTDAAEIRDKLCPATISPKAPESILASTSNSLPDMYTT
ncbi:basal body-orientation factor 1-like [Melanotaenia boesemani]|uniref:basal body-orientation factor 1-like n=1 Tax=Melanotaenia boesemani TaxID=1250792 RepID=UPI001C04656D|nr:basal body-orientation factor 1-like [Melanotaenia boesemani]